MCRSLLRDHNHNAVFVFPALKPTSFTNPTPLSFTSSSRNASTDFCLHRFFWATRFLIWFFSLFFVSGPRARLSWPSRQLLSARKSTVSYRIVKESGIVGIGFYRPDMTESSASRYWRQPQQMTHWPHPASSVTSAGNTSNPGDVKWNGFWHIMSYQQMGMKGWNGRKFCAVWIPTRISYDRATSSSSRIELYLLARTISAVLVACGNQNSSAYTQTVLL